MTFNQRSFVMRLVARFLRHVPILIVPLIQLIQGVRVRINHNTY
jgi:hypothetical protein